jgi:hypothetical protein
MKMKLLLAASAVLAAAGAAHAATDYTLTNTVGGIAEGYYGVGTTPITLRPDGAWGNYSAPDGKSDFDIFNAATVAGERFWYQSASVVAGHAYGVTLVIANNYSSPPVIQFSVDGQAYDATVTLAGPPYSNSITDGSPGLWATYHFYYTASSNGPVTFALTDTNLAASGNDFSVASVGIGDAPEPATWALMIAGVFGVGAALRLSRGRSVALAG